MRRDRDCDLIQEGRVGGVVRDEVGDVVGVEEDWHRRAVGRVGLSGLWPGDELACLAEEDPGERAAAACNQRVDDVAQDVVRFAVADDDPVDRFDRGDAQSESSSNSVTGLRKESGTGMGRRLARSSATIVCFAVASSTSGFSSARP